MIQGQLMVGDLVCGRMVGEGVCGKPGVGHFLWNLEGDNGVACVDHTPWAMSQAVDYHPLVDDCTMPGVQWRYSTADGAGRCEWPMETAEAEETKESVPA